MAENGTDKAAAMSRPPVGRLICPLSAGAIFEITPPWDDAAATLHPSRVAGILGFLPLACPRTPSRRSRDFHLSPRLLPGPVSRRPWCAAPSPPLAPAASSSFRLSLSLHPPREIRDVAAFTAAASASRSVACRAAAAASSRSRSAFPFRACLEIVTPCDRAVAVLGTLPGSRAIPAADSAFVSGIVVSGVTAAFLNAVLREDEEAA